MYCCWGAYDGKRYKSEERRLRKAERVCFVQVNCYISVSGIITFKNATSPTSNNLRGVTFGNNKFFTMLGSMNSSTGTVLTSSNGISWTSSSATCSSCGDNSSHNSLNDITYAE